MEIILESAHSPRMNSTGGVDLRAKFAHLAEEVDFTASDRDPHEHGRLILARALAGEFGEVAAYIPPTELEIAEKENPPKREQLMADAIVKFNHYTIFGNTTLATEWQYYYKALFYLAEKPEWPLVDFPAAPNM